MPSAPESEVVFKTRAGFGDPVNNRKVETAAVKFVTAQPKSEGYTVATRERENVGYDLEAKKRGSILHVEVKGVAGSLVQFPITVNEVRCRAADPTFRLFVVTGATSKSPTVHRFTWPEVDAKFSLNAIAFMAKLKARR